MITPQGEQTHEEKNLGDLIDELVRCSVVLQSRSNLKRLVEMDAIKPETVKQLLRFAQMLKSVADESDSTATATVS